MQIRKKIYIFINILLLCGALMLTGCGKSEVKLEGSASLESEFGTIYTNWNSKKN